MNENDLELSDTFETWKNKINNMNAIVTSVNTDLSTINETIENNAEKAYSDSINLVIALS